MGLATYFSKDALAISQVLNQGSFDILEQILNSHVIEIACDRCVLSGEGAKTVDLLVSLLARLYPSIKLTSLEEGNEGVLDRLKQKAKRINSNIEISERNSSIVIVIGTKVPNSIIDQPVFYVGSNKWVVQFSSSHPSGSGQGDLPFAAGIAACLAASNVFRYVFRSLIDDVSYDNEVSLSLIELSTSSGNSDLDLDAIEVFEDITLVGAGAIGNGFVWAISHMKNVEGILNIVDEQTVSLSNLQRYLLTQEADENRTKVEVAEEALSGTKFTVQPHPVSWQQYVNSSNNFSSSTLLTALDSGKDRIAVQAYLPKSVLNGFTEEGLLGVSRHFRFSETACLACVYLPTSTRKSRSEEVAENLGMLDKEVFVRGYLQRNLPVDEQLLLAISSANNIDIQKIRIYMGASMSEFYSNFVCGGTFFELKGQGAKNIKVDAPLAFQSAFAGILLASELFLWKSGYRDEFPTMTHFYPLLPMNADSNPYNHSLARDTTAKCVCNDEDFISVYKSKWAEAT